MSAILDRVERMREEVSELESFRREAIQISRDLEDRIEMMKSGIDVLYVNYIGSQSPRDQWGYWINRLDRAGFRLYYGSSGEFRFVHWPDLKADEKKALAAAMVWGLEDNPPENPLLGDLLEAIKKKLGKA